MIKSGLILAVVALLFSLGSSFLISPLCVPCIGLFLGLAAGYLACVFDNPVENGEAVMSGALAGVIGGVGALLGQLIGAGIKAVVVDRAVMDILSPVMESLDGYSAAVQPNSWYWIGPVAFAGFLGLLNIALMAGLGALGAILWYQFSDS